MAKKLHLYVARHGETPYKSEFMRGWSNHLPLSEKGEKQATQLGKRLKALGVENIVSDDLTRTKQTADIVRGITGVRPIFDPSIRPWQSGILEGTRVAETLPQLLYYVKNPLEAVEGGEPYQDFWDRWSGALHYYMRRVKQMGETWAIIAHATELLATEAILSGKKTPIPLKGDPDPGTIYQIDVDACKCQKDI